MQDRSAAVMMVEIGTSLAAAQVAEAALVEPPVACISAESSTFINHDCTVCLDAGLRESPVVRI